MRTTKELLELLLEKLPKYFKDPDCDGLCLVSLNLNLYGVIREEEHRKLLDYINFNRPTYWFNKNYGWKPGRIRPRKRWLKKQIKKLENENII